MVTAAKLRAPERCMEGRGPQGQREAVGEPELAGDRGVGRGVCLKGPVLLWCTRFQAGSSWQAGEAESQSPLF